MGTGPSVAHTRLCYRRSVARLRGLLFATLFVVGPTGCLLYTDPINVKPQVVIHAPEQIFRGQPATFTAMATDPDQDPATLRLEWFEGQDGAPCPTDADEAVRDQTARRGVSRDLILERKTLGRFCVWVVVTDRYGARGFAAHPAEVRNRAPTATITLINPTLAGATTSDPLAIALYSDVHLSGATSEDADGDRLDFRWTLIGPKGQPVTPSKCLIDAVEASVCFRADAPGAYRVDLLVTDGIDESKPARQEILAEPDAPPCIRETDPPVGLRQIVRFADAETTFEVRRVEDDGDPFPAPPGRTTDSAFVWQYREGNDDFERTTATSLSTFGFPPNRFRPGAELEVRLQYFDRVRNRDLRTCALDQPVCELRPGCYQWVTWTVRFL
jgi:hypothetical protein